MTVTTATTTPAERFTFTTRINGAVVSVQTGADPFALHGVTLTNDETGETTLVEVLVDADRETVRRVMLVLRDLDAEPLPGPVEPSGDLVAFGEARTYPHPVTVTREELGMVDPDVSVGAVVEGHQGPPPAPVPYAVRPGSEAHAVKISSEGAGAGSPERPTR